MEFDIIIRMDKNKKGRKTEWSYAMEYKKIRTKKDDRTPKIKIAEYGVENNGEREREI